MTRVLTSLVLIPLVCYIVIWAPKELFLAVLVLVALLCYRDYSTITAAYGFGSAGPLGYIAGPAMLLTSWGDALLFSALTLIVLAVALRFREISQAWPWTALLVLGLAYIFGG